MSIDACDPVPCAHTGILAIPAGGTARGAADANRFTAGRESRDPGVIAAVIRKRRPPLGVARHVWVERSIGGYLDRRCEVCGDREVLPLAVVT
jgi:hypothetical protein